MTITKHPKGIILSTETVVTSVLSIIQAQNILLSLGYDKDALFEALWAMEENLWTRGYLGICGSFMYGE